MICNNCNGTGSEMAYPTPPDGATWTELCRKCNGTGKVEQIRWSSKEDSPRSDGNIYRVLLPNEEADKELKDIKPMRSAVQGLSINIH